MELVSDEGKRIISLKLASRDELNDLLEPTIESAMKKASANTDSLDVLLGILSDLHLKLAAIKLPGDFAKFAADEKFYEALDIPYKGEPFYQVPEKKKPEPSEEDIEEEAQEKLEEYIESEEEGTEEIEKVVSAVSNYLEKLAYGLGREGNHEAAYAIERTIHSIRTLNKRGK